MIHSITYQGCKGQLIQIEGAKSPGFSGIHLIGNVSDVIKEGKERAKAAINHLGISLPAQKIVMSFSPADTPKCGSHLDLAVALELLRLSEPDNIKIQWDKIKPWLVMSELNIRGDMPYTRNCIAACLVALEQKFEGIIISRANFQEVAGLLASIRGHSHALKVRAFDHFKDVLDFLVCDDHYEPPKPNHTQNNIKPTPTFQNMTFSKELEDIAVVTVGGMHSLLLKGTPGTGKTLFAHQLSRFLPRLAPKNHVETMQVYSSRSEPLPNSVLKGVAPFRSPHHQASRAAVLGSQQQPGEVSLANGGILFLDEFPEFRRDIIEGLREPIQNKKIYISLAQFKIEWPADFLFIAAMNNCPCGWYQSSKKMCYCPTSKVQKYQNKISGPILDRIDLIYTMPEKNHFIDVSEEKDKTESISNRIQELQSYMFQRNQPFRKKYNHHLHMEELKQTLGRNIPDIVKTIGEEATQSLSTRSFVKLLRVTRTLADADQAPSCSDQHIQKALKWVGYQKESELNGI